MNCVSTEFMSVGYVKGGEGFKRLVARQSPVNGMYSLREQRFEASPSLEGYTFTSPFPFVWWTNAVDRINPVNYNLSEEDVIAKMQTFEGERKGHTSPLTPSRGKIPHFSTLITGKCLSTEWRVTEKGGVGRQQWTTVTRKVAEPAKDGGYNVHTQSDLFDSEGGGNSLYNPNSLGSRLKRAFFQPAVGECSGADVVAAFAEFEAQNPETYEGFEIRGRSTQHFSELKLVK